MDRFEQSEQRLLGEVNSVTERLSVIEGPTGRRNWPDDEKARIVMESFAPGARVGDVARRNRMTPQQLSTWRGLARKGKLALPAAPETEQGFAVVELDEGSAAASDRIEIDAGGLTVRLAPATPATRIAEIIAEIAVALRAIGVPGR
jgi:transposase